MANPLVWALIVVSYSANVSLSTGYQNKALCEDAINIAKTGMTIKEEKAEKEKARIAQVVADGKWRLEHPLRTPTEDDKKNCSRKDAHGSTSGTVIMNSNTRCVIEEDGLVHEYQQQSLLSITKANIIGITMDYNAIKYAKCVLIEPEDAK